MSSTQDDDPFLQVQTEALAQLTATRSLFASYLRIRSLQAASASQSPELAAARADLEAALLQLADDLADLEESVAAAQTDPGRFRLGAREVAQRARFVQEMGGEIENMRQELRRRAVGSGSNGGGGGSAARRSPPPEQSTHDDAADGYAQLEQQHQQLVMREQDQQLDGVLHTVGNLRRQADVMGRELEEQMVLIEEVDQVADRVGSRLQSGVRKLQGVMRKNEERLGSCCIAVLIAVLIVLLVLLVVL